MSIYRYRGTNLPASLPSCAAKGERNCLKYPAILVTKFQSRSIFHWGQGLLAGDQDPPLQARRNSHMPGNAPHSPPLPLCICTSLPADKPAHKNSFCILQCIVINLFWSSFQVSKTFQVIKVSDKVG